MRPSRLALVGLALIFGLAAWILFRSESAGSGVVPGAEGASAGAAGAPLPGAAGSSGGSSGLDRAEADVHAGAAGEAGAALITGPRLIVKVMDIVKGVAVPGATVWVFDPDLYDEDEFSAALKTEADWEVLAARFARKLLADEQGIAVIAQPRRWVRLLGRHGQRYGEHYQDAGHDGQIVKLLLEPDSALRVRVTDARDQALAGVPVGLRMKEGEQSEWLAERTSGADGRTTFAHVQRIAFRRSGSAEIALAPALPLTDPPVLPVRLSAIPEEEQILILPATGSVRVRLLDPDRRPMLGPARVMLQETLVKRPDWLDENEFVPWPLNGSHTAEAENGEARFAFVGLGLGLELGVDFDGTWNYEMTQGRGPERAGEEVVIEAVQRVLRPSLVLRVLRPDGTPLAGADLEILLRTSTVDFSNAQSADETTDGEGWLRYTLAGEWVQERTDVQRSLEIHYQEPDSELQYAGRLPGRAAWRAGPNELGDLRLEALPVYAAGFVADEAGTPIVGANVTMSRRSMRRGRESWRDDYTMSDRTGPDGRFELVGFLPEGVYRLSARHADFKPETLPWREKASDHQIVLKRGRFLKGRVLLEPDLAAGNLELRVVAAGTEIGSGNSEAQARLDRYGTFSCGPGVSDRVDLWIFDRQTEQVLYRVESLASHDPGADPDPRLDPLDLRGRIYEVAVVVRSQTEEKLENGLSFALSRDSSEPEDWSGTDQPSFKVLVADEGWKLWLQAEGYRREIVDLVGRKVEVSLRSGPRVNIRLADAGVRALSDQMWIAVRKDGPDDNQDNQSWHELSGEGTPLSLEQAGFYRLTLYVRQRSAEDDWNWTIYPPEGFPIEVRDLSGVQDIVLPWTEAEVRAAMPIPQGN